MHTKSTVIKPLSLMRIKIETRYKKQTPLLYLRSTPTLKLIINILEKFTKLLY